VALPHGGKRYMFGQFPRPTLRGQPRQHGEVFSSSPRLTHHRAIVKCYYMSELHRPHSVDADRGSSTGGVGP